jgi:hypothetical protein
MEVFSNPHLFKLILEDLQYNDVKNLRVCKQLQTIPYPIDTKIKGIPIKYHEMSPSIFHIIDVFLKHGIINGITYLIKRCEFQCSAIAIDILRKSIAQNIPYTTIIEW